MIGIGRKPKGEQVSIESVGSQKVEALARRSRQAVVDVKESWDTFTPEEKALLMKWGEKLGMKLAAKAGRELMMGDGNTAIQSVMTVLAEQNSPNLDLFMRELLKGFING